VGACDVPSSTNIRTGRNHPGISFWLKEPGAAGAVALRLMICRWLRIGALPPAAPDRVFSGHLERAQDPGSSLPAPREHCPRAFHTKGASGEA